MHPIHRQERNIQKSLSNKRLSFRIYKEFQLLKTKTTPFFQWTNFEHMLQKIWRSDQ